MYIWMKNGEKQIRTEHAKKPVIVSFSILISWKWRLGLWSVNYIRRWIIAADCEKTERIQLRNPVCSSGVQERYFAEWISYHLYYKFLIHRLVCNVSYWDKSGFFLNITSFQNKRHARVLPLPERNPKYWKKRNRN